MSISHILRSICGEILAFPKALATMDKIRTTRIKLNYVLLKMNGEPQVVPGWVEQMPRYLSTNFKECVQDKTCTAPRQGNTFFYCWSFYSATCKVAPNWVPYGPTRVQCWVVSIKPQVSRMLGNIHADRVLQPQQDVSCGKENTGKIPKQQSNSTIRLLINAVGIVRCIISNQGAFCFSENDS